MTGRKRSSERVDPFFESGSRSGANGELRLSASDRVTGSGSKRAAKPQRPARKKGRRRSGGGFLGLIRFAAYWTIVLGIWGGIGVAGVVIYYGARMPNASTWSIPERPPNVKIVSVNGETIANRGTTGGEALALEDMSPYIPQAVVAIEDRRFYSHFGIDPLGLARAMITNVTTGRMVQGGSTLTQQLAKNLFLSPERTLERKVQEVLLAFWLEQNYTKDQILAMYLNRVFFGSNAYGVEAASRRYFNKSARDVNLGEAALLAGLLKAPSRLSPARDPAAAEARAQVVLGAMHDQDLITDSEVASAKSQPPTKAKSYWSGAQYYAADMVMDEVKRLIGDIKQDIVVDTTLDMGLEHAADRTLSTLLAGDGAKQGASQAALVAIDGTGAIRALVGGRDYATSQFNRAVRAKRQPGSAFKPFVYAAALEAGVSPDSMRNDARVRIGNWTPENYDQKFRGPVTISTALAQSLNTIAAQLVMEAGPDQVVSFAHRMGIESTLQPNASIALGTSEVSLTELTAAYAPFMNGGYKATPHIVRRIASLDGKVLYENTYGDPPRVLSDTLAATMNSMLTRVVTEGTGKAARLDGWQAAGKSGTTQSFRDALFVGYTSNLTTGVWFGNDDGTPMKKVTGGGLPARAWKEFMTAAHKGLSPSPLFGLGRGDPVAAVPPPQDIPAAHERPQTSILDIISGVFPGEREPAPQPRVTPERTGATTPLPPASGGFEQPLPPGRSAAQGGPVPPADVGAAPGQPPAGRRTTLLDVILGN
ncbi:PBP1A family penicillin-binding protein [Rhizobiaceae bacterium BDR2-2]|uniref:PBP1A family penicillin-binding protein n=1 Tax=Ectorhizobium quercum TaxID=2965071 RepID=A0AAE3STF3_9HYPH|nr:PBP1A family penicillin-binding protein [Ectorhizobium quercum]MCX8995633.1 PBP1A family penicillin-binding protein [Ectorhizobium quercum]